MKKLLLYAALFISFLGKAQNVENLYLISGHPYEDTDEEFASYLWHYSDNSLDTILLLSSKDDFLENVKVYPEQKLVVVHKTNSIRRTYLENNHRLLFIHYEDSINVDKELKIETDGIFKYYLSLEDENLLLDMFSNERGNHFKKVKIENLSIEECAVDNFIYAKLTGIPGGMIYGKDYLVVYSNEQNGVLEIPLVGDRNKRPKYPYILPEKYHFKIYARHLIPVNNSQIFVLGSDKHLEDGAIGSKQILFLLKNKKQWHDITIPGSIAKIRGFGE